MVTLTARHKGLCGNEIPVSLNYYGFGGGEVLPAGIQIAVASGTAGTGAPVLTGTIAAMVDEPFDYIGHPFSDAASVNTLSNEMNDTSGRWSYARQLYGNVYTAKLGTLSELVTAGDMFNLQHITPLVTRRRPRRLPMNWRQVAQLVLRYSFVMIRPDRHIPGSWLVCCQHRRASALP